MQRRQRLTGDKRFALIHKEGRSWANRYLVLKALPNGLDDSRFGFSTSRRVGNAVTRNRVKRRLREVIRSSQVKPGWDVLIMGRTGVGTADFHHIETALQNLLRRANLLDAPPLAPGTHDFQRVQATSPDTMGEDSSEPNRSKRC